MKKLFSLLFVAMLAMSAWADVTVTFVPGTTVGQYTGANQYDEMTLDGVTISGTKSALNANPYRFAAGSKATVTSTVGNIKKVEFTCEGSYSQGYGPDQFYGDGYTCQSGSHVGTWQGDAESFTLSTASQVRCTLIVVTIAEETVDELVPPVFHPDGGEFTGSLEVTLTCPTTNCEIYYFEGTPDGDWANYSYYNGPFYVTETKTYTAYSSKGGEISEYVTVTFTKVEQTVEAPVFTPAAGGFYDRINVTLACATPNATIYYSLDNELWSQYVDPIPVTDDITIWAKAKVGNVESEVVSATYTKLPATTYDVVFNAREDFGDGDWLRHHFTIEKDGVTMYVGDGQISTAGHYRIYGPNDSSAFNFTSAGAPIIKIEFSGLFGYYASHMSLAEGIGGTWTTDGNDGVWEGSAQFVDFNINMQARFVTITVTLAAPPYLRGDVDGNKEVNISDVILLINYLSGLDVEVDERAANCSLVDDQINITDAIMLINYLSNGMWPDE
jgi:hypothetical protein